MVNSIQWRHAVESTVGWYDDAGQRVTCLQFWMVFHLNYDV